MLPIQCTDHSQPQKQIKKKKILPKRIEA